MAAKWPVNQRLANYTYERGEGRLKHRWKHDSAGFRPSKRGPIGKCHSSISEALAQDLLRSGFAAESPYEDDPDPPDQVYNLYRGVPYVAVPTELGKSYHGYPWAGRMPASIKEKLRARAVQEKTQRVFERWLKKYTKSR